MINLQRQARRLILSTLKARAALTAIVPASSIYPNTTPANVAWPFVKTGAITVSGFTNGVCEISERVNVPVHAFAKSLPGETAEDLAGRIGGEIVDALNFKRFSITGGFVHMKCTDINLFQDALEAGAYHWFSNIDCRVIVGR